MFFLSSCLQHVNDTVRKHLIPSRFANGLDNKADLYGGEGTSGIGHAIALQGLLKLGLKTDPMHEFAASDRLGNVGLLS